MGSMIQFPMNGASGGGYLATPTAGSGPGIVVIQEWWGLVDHIKTVADRLAAAGFVALAPDFYNGQTTTQRLSSPAAKWALETTLSIPF